jgi:transcriptional regulator with XRE-family HTH domain
MKGTIASRIKRTRESHGLSALDLDKRAKLTPGHVSKIESGERENPTIRTIAVLAIALQVSIGWLVSGEA